MFDIITTIGIGIEKVVDDVTTAAEAALPYIADLAFGVRSTHCRNGIMKLTICRQTHA